MTVLMRRLLGPLLPAVLLGLAAGCGGPDTRATTPVPPTVKPGKNLPGLPSPPPPPTLPK